ncbi:hypothetical protein P8935_09120 [Telmatobacter sp. DSM 110680]|uniref:Trypsin-like peptidase domain-containing protein n=1 Tax=Telmatobacter sp. DSM 110680 TaxID=3036704 RepID=A0AAU7DP93_9BACT
MPLATQAVRHQLLPRTRAHFSLRCGGLKLASAFLVAGTALLSGCGAGPVTASSSANAAFSISPGTALIDTNCNGCNSLNDHASPVHQFSATLNSGGSAPVTWSVSGGDPASGAGRISANGQYTPPNYLSADRAQIMITAALKSDPSIRATSLLTLTPGFLQPLTPENAAVGAGGAVTVTGFLAEAGGAGEIHFALSNSPSGDSGGEGTLSATSCQRTRHSFTTCSVTYTAPATVSTGVTYVVATLPGSSAKIETAVLLNTVGVSSNPATHQGSLSAPMLLGSSGGNNNDFDEKGNTILDCCSGTLGALVQDSSGRQYLLSNNHVLARSDHAAVGDTVVQPGLIDNNCTPNGDGAGTVPVAALTAWLPLHSPQTNVDAAIAGVASHTVDTTGSILELGVRQTDGSLGAAPPGISSTEGKGESATLQLRVAKSGRTTGLTCGRVTAFDLDVSVDYYRDCAETKPYLTKLFTNQISVSGDHFSDAGDSGALIVDSANAEPVGLFFAGGIDAAGVSHGIANPAPDVLNALSTQLPGDSSFSFVGTTDHEVSCLNYGDSTISSAQARALSNSEFARQQAALAAGRALVNPSTGILGVAAGKSSDEPGSAALIVYVDENLTPSVPSAIENVRTIVIPATAHSVSLGSAPTTATVAGLRPLAASALTPALQAKRLLARKLMQQNSAFFAVGIGQSLDNPREAALVIYVDRERIPAQLPSLLNGVRTRYVFMDRLHVTRSYAAAFPAPRHCIPHTIVGPTFDDLFAPRPLDLP